MLHVSVDNITIVKNYNEQDKTDTKSTKLLANNEKFLHIEVH